MTKREQDIAALDTLMGALRDARRQLCIAADDSHEATVYGDLIQRLREATAESDLAKIVTRKIQRMN